MKSKKSGHFFEERHPSWYHPIPDMEILILGSFPPPPNKEGFRKSRHYEFYYPNRRNKFWDILAKAGGIQPPVHSQGDDAVTERKQIMTKLKVGIENIAKVVKRKGRSSRDSDLEIIEYHDIDQIVTNAKNLKTILLPAFSGSFCTYRLFLQHMVEERGWMLIKTNTKIAAKVEFKISKGGRAIRCIIANSTSPLTRISTEKLIEQFSLAFKK